MAAAAKSSLLGKCLYRLALAMPTLAATSSTVIASKPFSASSKFTAWMIAFSRACSICCLKDILTGAAVDMTRILTAQFKLQTPRLICDSAVFSQSSGCNCRAAACDRAAVRRSITSECRFQQCQYRLTGSVTVGARFTSLPVVQQLAHHQLGHQAGAPARQHRTQLPLGTGHKALAQRHPAQAQRAADKFGLANRPCG